MACPTPRLDFSFAIWIFDPARQSDHAVVRQHVAIEWIQSGIVDVGDEHAFAQVVEHHDAGTATQSAKGFLVQLGPDARAGAEGQQAYRLAAVAERQHEQSCASIFAGLRIADHRAGAVIDLGFFSGRGDDHRARLRCLVSAELANEALDGLIAAAEPTLGHQVLPDRHGIATLAQTQFDRLTERFAETGGRERACGGFSFSSRSTPRQTRWSPHWPVLQFLLLLFLRWKVGFGVAVGVGVTCWPVLPRPTRWSPRWPVLPAVAVPTPPAAALRSRPLSGRRRRSPDAPRSLARCAAVAIRVVPGLSLVVFSLRSRRCSYRRRLLPCVGINVPGPHSRWPVFR